MAREWSFAFFYVKNLDLFSIDKKLGIYEINFWNSKENNTWKGLINPQDVLVKTTHGFPYSHGKQIRKKDIEPSSRQREKDSQRMSHDPLDHIPPGICGIFQMPAQRKEQAFQSLASTRRSSTGCGNNNQQKSSQCRRSQPTKNAEWKLGCGLPRLFCPIN